VIERGAVQEMKDCRPFGFALRGEIPNHLMLPWLKSQRLSVYDRGVDREASDELDADELDADDREQIRVS
jgi:hypothetical protein